MPGSTDFSPFADSVAWASTSGCAGWIGSRAAGVGFFHANRRDARPGAWFSALAWQCRPGVDGAAGLALHILPDCPSGGDLFSRLDAEPARKKNRPHGVPAYHCGDLRALALQQALRLLQLALCTAGRARRDLLRTGVAGPAATRGIAITHATVDTSALRWDWW